MFNPAIPREVAEAEFLYTQDVLKEKANLDPDLTQLNIDAIDFINIRLAAAFPGKNVSAMLKGSNAYALLYKNAVQKGFTSIDPELEVIQGDWDTNIVKPDEISPRQVDTALKQIMLEVGQRIQANPAVPAILQRIEDSIPLISYGGIPHKMKIISNLPNSVYGITTYSVKIDDNEDGSHFILHRLVIMFNAVNQYTGLIKRSTREKDGYFFAEMIDVGMDTEKAKSYGKKFFPVHIQVPPIPADKTHIYTFGYDDMFLDLHLMSWEEKPTKPVPIRKQPKRRKRFAKLLTSLFCRPEFFPLRLPIQNPKFISTLFNIGVAKPITGFGPMDICKDTTKIGWDNKDYDAKQSSNLIEAIFNACPPEMLKNYKELFVSSCLKKLTLSPEQRQNISQLYDGLQSDEMCILLKEFFILCVSWYANDYFQAVGLVYLISWMGHKNINRYHAEVECALKEFDLRHYITMSENFEAVLELLNEICTTINNGFRGTIHQVNAQIAGGGGFAYHLNKRLAKNPNVRTFIPTADLDISIVSNYDLAETSALRNTISIFDAYTQIFAKLATVKDDNGTPFVYHGASGEDPDGNRSVRHIGYKLPATTVNGYTIPITYQHFFELFFLNKGQDLSPAANPYLTTATTSKGELPYVKIYKIPNLIDESDNVSKLPNMETYKRKKYQLRSKILTEISGGNRPFENELKALVNVGGCSENTIRLYNAWISQTGMTRLLALPNTPVVQPVPGPPAVPVAQPVPPPAVQPARALPVAQPVPPPAVQPAQPVPPPVAQPVAQPVDAMDVEPEPVAQPVPAQAVPVGDDMERQKDQVRSFLNTKPQHVEVILVKPDGYRYSGAPINIIALGWGVVLVTASDPRERYEQAYQVFMTIPKQQKILQNYYEVYLPNGSSQEEYDRSDKKAMFFMIPPYKPIDPIRWNPQRFTFEEEGPYQPPVPEVQARRGRRIGPYAQAAPLETLTTLPPAKPPLKFDDPWAREQAFRAKLPPLGAPLPAFKARAGRLQLDQMSKRRRTYRNKTKKRSNTYRNKH